MTAIRIATDELYPFRSIAGDEDEFAEWVNVSPQQIERWHRIEAEFYAMQREMKDAMAEARKRAVCDCAPDCEERINCECAGTAGHWSCGWCGKCSKAKHRCVCPHP